MNNTENGQLEMPRLCLHKYFWSGFSFFTQILLRSTKIIKSRHTMRKNKQMGHLIRKILGWNLQTSRYLKKSRYQNNSNNLDYIVSEWAQQMTSRCYKSDKKLVNSSSALTTFTPGVDILDIPRRAASPNVLCPHNELQSIRPKTTTRNNSALHTANLLLPKYFPWTDY